MTSTTNPSSTSYDPLAQFRSDREPAQVSSEYIEGREVVSAFTGEDSAGRAFVDEVLDRKLWSS